MVTGETESDRPDADLFVATLREQRAAERRWLADAGSSSDPKAKLFAAVHPWLTEKIKDWASGPMADFNPSRDRLIHSIEDLEEVQRRSATGPFPIGMVFVVEGLEEEARRRNRS